MPRKTMIKAEIAMSFGAYSRRFGGAVIAILAFAAILRADAFAARSDLRQVCFECHKESREMTSKAVVHKPVSEGKCSECHNPHASRGDKLIDSSVSEMCGSCHSGAAKYSGEGVHKPVKDGKCVACHDPHSSDSKWLLSKSGGESCFACHKKEEIAGQKNLHPEVRKGNCLACHDAHVSKNPALLVKERSKLCLGCHSSESKVNSVHKGFSAAGTDCASCHSPHGSDNVALLRKNQHKPFKNRECTACHVQGSAKLKSVGSEICINCHESSLKSFNKIYSHLTSSKNPNMCIECHGAHGSDGKGLLKDTESRVCYACHQDTKARVVASKFTHSTLGNCSSCHAAHGSNNRYFMSSASNTCFNEGCHASQGGTFSHIIGENVIDPRSKEGMTCWTCHNPMGAPEEFSLRLGKDRDLCVLCHRI